MNKLPELHEPTEVDMSHEAHVGHKHLELTCPKCMDEASINEEHFESIGAARWERITTAVKAKLGLDITTNSGEQKAKGIVLAWDYRPEDPKQTLDIRLVSREWYDPSAAVIDARVKEWIDATALDYVPPVADVEVEAPKKTKRDAFGFTKEEPSSEKPVTE